ncbi:MAG: transcriptional repressor LexA [Gammaproteobacteria bacterium]|jgi:repressor LexA|nr:transcriptional repressor LexA [Gammaproteobacteria bacterium]
MEALTDIQQAVYDYTRKALQQGQPFPSLRDIAQHFGFQHTTARFHLKALEKKGYVRQRSQRVSDYLLPDLSHEIEMHPGCFDLVARIPAGAPSPVFDETPESFSVTHDFFGGGDILGLTVVGDSMSGDSIADGDIAMIKRQQEANKGDILALRIEDEITLKRLQIKADKAHLLPSNPEHPVRVVPAASLEILGKLVGIIRKV